MMSAAANTPAAAPCRRSAPGISAKRALRRASGMQSTLPAPHQPRAEQSNRSRRRTRPVWRLPSKTSKASVIGSKPTGRQRRRLHNWGFHELRALIEYKSADAGGVPVDLVDPRNTSRQCSCCGLIDKRNRPSRDQFKSIGCGVAAPADHNAALNIRQRALTARDAYGSAAPGGDMAFGLCQPRRKPSALADGALHPLTTQRMRRLGHAAAPRAFGLARWFPRYQGRPISLAQTDRHNSCIPRRPPTPTLRRRRRDRVWQRAFTAHLSPERWVGARPTQSKERAAVTYP